MPLRYLYFLTWVCPPPFFLNNVQKIADLVKRYIPYHDGHLQMDGPLWGIHGQSGCHCCQGLFLHFNHCWGKFWVTRCLADYDGVLGEAGISFDWGDLKLTALTLPIPSHICQTAVQQKCQVTASNGNGNDDGSDDGGSIEPSSSTCVSMASFLLIASIIVLSI